jgi:hypothetical protein
MKLDIPKVTSGECVIGEGFHVWNNEEYYDNDDDADDDDDDDNDDDDVLDANDVVADDGDHSFFEYLAPPTALGEHLGFQATS